jgi:pimeloyl-ACP methyl ester carboxylesterase
MLRVREYGQSGPHVIVLHGGPGAAGHMAPVAGELAESYRVIEPFQRGGGGERLTVARHVADLHEIIAVYAPRCRPALVGASWGAMLALAYAAAHPGSAGPLILVGCGTFDLGARAELQRTIAERMTGDIRARLKCADELDPDERLKASAEAMLPIYASDLLASPLEDDHVDARAHNETWNDMVRLQAEGIYPAAFTAIRVPVLMIHGTYDPFRDASSSKVYGPICRNSNIGSSSVVAIIHGWKGLRSIHSFLSCMSGWLAIPTRPADDVLSRRTPFTQWQA